MTTPIEEIKARIDIVDFVSETVQLRKSGKSYTGFCPFHSNTRTPAFVVFPESGTWRCFGQCNEGGDIFKFVMKKENLDFAEALRLLADKAGITLAPLTPQQSEQTEAEDSLRQLLEDAALFFQHNLTNTQAGQNALTYLLQRGLSEEIIQTFGLGYAPNAWDALTQHFRKRGITEEDLLAAGLVSARDSGGVYDKFRHRVTFPIRDERGRMAGFGARVLNPEDLPKFLNSPQTAVFDKGKLLYGLDRARRSIRAQDQAVIVEGYLDVIALHQHGYTNVVSPMGTALTEHHLSLLKRLTRNIVLALDPDAAGDKATLRGLQIARQTLERESDPVFDARGLLGYENRLSANIRIATLPDGLDPDDVVKRNPAEWQTILDAARPIVVHVLEVLSSQRDLSDPRQKSELAAQILPLIEDLPNPIERDAYRQMLARHLKVDERSLISSVTNTRPAQRNWRSPTRSDDRARLADLPPEAPFLANQRAIAKLENLTLGILLRRPNFIHSLDRFLQEQGLGRLTDADFSSAEHQTLFTYLQRALIQDEADPLHYLLNDIPETLHESADTCLSQAKNYESDEDRAFRELTRAILDLRSRDLKQRGEHFQQLLQDVEQQKLFPDLAQSVMQIARARQRIDRALKQDFARMLFLPR
ncbi:MAG: DNA primase [Anaerolineales bacterium]